MTKLLTNPLLSSGKDRRLVRRRVSAAPLDRAYHPYGVSP